MHRVAVWNIVVTTLDAGPPEKTMSRPKDRPFAAAAFNDHCHDGSSAGPVVLVEVGPEAKACFPLCP